MQTWSLKASPVAALEQADSFQFGYFLIIAPNGITPGSPIMVSAGGSAVKNYPAEIGIMFPWDNPNGPFWGPFAIDGTGALSNPSGIVMTVPASPSGPLAPEGMLVCSAITGGGGRNPFGGFVCAYQDATATPPPAPPTPSLATFIAAVQNSWNSHVPVVDFLAPATWTTGNYQTIVPYSSAPVTVPFGAPIALSSKAAAAIVALLGGSIVPLAPVQADYNNYYEDPGAVQGSLTPVNYIQAEVPIGPNGANVLGQALGGAIASAIFYGRVSGIQAAVLACFKPVA
jgi:hypothetical protein